ncbi:MAG: PepSY-like domain-containing protein [Bacteroidia bacterium]|nr:PepSY-like domain-containing protein [Bacteroidia bacterium]
MKLLILTTALLALSTLSTAQKIQKNNLPSSVSAAFQEEFPKAIDVEWKKKDSLYHVEFELGSPKKDHEIHYNQQGKIVYHEEDITVDQLPAQVLKEVRTLYPGFQIEEVEKINNRSLITYHMEVEKDSEEWKLRIDEQGKIVDKKED